jgi:hypothetical protein
MLRLQLEPATGVWADAPLANLSVGSVVTLSLLAADDSTMHCKALPHCLCCASPSPRVLRNAAGGAVLASLLQPVWFTLSFFFPGEHLLAAPACKRLLALRKRVHRAPVYAHSCIPCLLLCAVFCGCDVRFLSLPAPPEMPPASDLEMAESKLLRPLHESASDALSRERLREDEEKAVLAGAARAEKLSFVYFFLVLLSVFPVMVCLGSSLPPRHARTAVECLGLLELLAVLAGYMTARSTWAAQAKLLSMRSPGDPAPTPPRGVKFLRLPQHPHPLAHTKHSSRLAYMDTAGMSAADKLCQICGGEAGGQSSGVLPWYPSACKGYQCVAGCKWIICDDCVPDARLQGLQAEIERLKLEMGRLKAAVTAEMVRERSGTVVARSVAAQTEEEAE